MSDIINRVPRELLERIACEVTPKTHQEMFDSAKDFAAAIKELRALLSEQPQASAAQSAPAGERETIRAVFLRNGFTVKEGQTDLKPYVYAAAEELLSIVRASWQRTQSPGVPEGRECPRYVCRKCKQETRPPEPYKAYVLCDCGYMTSATTALAAAPAQPAARGECCHEFVPFQQACVKCGEPYDSPAAQDQGEVQSRERWTVVCGHWQDTTLAIHGERTGHIASGIDEDAARAIINAHNEGLPPIAAASTGQEVES